MVAVFVLQPFSSVLPGIVFGSFDQANTVDDKNVLLSVQEMTESVHQSTIDGPSTLGATKRENHLSSFRYLKWHGLTTVRSQHASDRMAHRIPNHHAIFREKSLGFGKG